MDFRKSSPSHIRLYLSETADISDANAVSGITAPEVDKKGVNPGHSAIVKLYAASIHPDTKAYLITPRTPGKGGTSAPAMAGAVDRITSRTEFK